MVWMYKLYILLLLCMNYSVEASIQVPAILYSYNLVPGMRTYQNISMIEAPLPTEEFTSVAKKLIESCNSDAYIFINIPGISVNDFNIRASAWRALSKYISGSSTALRFEKVLLDKDSDILSNLLDYTKTQCEINDVIELSGTNPDQFTAYIDTNRRVIRVDLPQLPAMTEEEDDDSRNDAIIAYDRFLRTILAQIPSPRHTVILTSLSETSNNRIAQDILEDPEDGIFPAIFTMRNNTEDVEKNNQVLQSDIYFPEYSPKFSSPVSECFTIFDQEFIKNNMDLIKLTVMTTVGYLTWIFWTFLTKPPTPKTLKKGASKSKKGERLKRSEKKE